MNYTIVTGLWDLGRENLKGWGKREFKHYKERFFTFLKTNAPMVIFVPKDLEEEVLDIRKDLPTHIIRKEVVDFETWNPFFDKIEEIRTSKEWRSLASWLVESPQGGLKYYNPMMFTKVFMVNDAAIINPFNTEYFYWIDGGITNTVPSSYFLEEKVLDKVAIYNRSIGKKIIHLSYEYTGNNEIHGFERKAIARYCNTDFVDSISRGGFFGGHKEQIHKYNELYYNLADETLSQGLMGADESLFTILKYRHSDLVYSFEIESNGLVWPFFDMLKNFDTQNVSVKDPIVGLYVLTYNSPDQFELLCKSMESYDESFLKKTKKFLINNSLDESTFKKYDELCNKYKFTEIHKDNIGICGGRQYVAEHADKLDLDFHLFFEDDMFFYLGENLTCRNGMPRKINKLYDKSLEIINNNKLDFIKLNFSEFYGDNTRQWSWYNIPQSDREKYFPDNSSIDHTSKSKIPFLSYENISSHDGLAYATGEVFYCNWPQIVSKRGNEKMFLETTWEYPYEQTWMSHIFRLTKEGYISPGILLATPTEHDRFDHYPKEERREN